MSNIINDNTNNISINKWNDLKIRKKYLEIFSNIINKNNYFFLNYNNNNNTNLNKYISNSLKEEIKFIYYKKINYFNKYSSNIKNIKVSYIDAHGSYLKDMVKLPDNIIVCHITPVNRFSTLSTLNRKNIFDSIFNEINIIEMFNKGLSCYQKIL